MRELCMKKVPKTLNEDQKLARKEVASKRPETRHQTMRWKIPASPRPK